MDTVGGSLLKKDLGVRRTLERNILGSPSTCKREQHPVHISTDSVTTARGRDARIIQGNGGRVDAPPQCRSKSQIERIKRKRAPRSWSRRSARRVRYTSNTPSHKHASLLISAHRLPQTTPHARSTNAVALYAGTVRCVGFSAISHLPSPSSPKRGALSPVSGRRRDARPLCRSGRRMHRPARNPAPHRSAGGKRPREGHYASETGAQRRWQSTVLVLVLPSLPIATRHWSPGLADAFGRVPHASNPHPPTA
ncbi:hypothetical protein DFH06DRAFT_1365721 [Mycena polygramma]|nr:hypothetical protein DFH06DRAFT_1365721 [Mycena polygramma]